MTDSKSVGLITRVGSSPTTGTTSSRASLSSRRFFYFIANSSHRFATPSTPLCSVTEVPSRVSRAPPWLLLSALFLMKVGNLERIMFWAFIIGNVLYYGVGIALAFAFKDNRAFYKYSSRTRLLPSRTRFQDRSGWDFCYKWSKIDWMSMNEETFRAAIRVREAEKAHNIRTFSHWRGAKKKDP